MLRRKRWMSGIACGLLATAVFVVDTVTPRGIEGTALYSAVVSLAILVQSRAFVIAVAASCSVLTILGYIVSLGDGAPFQFSAANRGFAILGVWLIATVGLFTQHFRTTRDRLQDHIDVQSEHFRLARRIQQKLFPKASPSVPGFDIAGVCRPADATGGDYFDFIPLADGHLGIAVGDVSSHGFGSALLMAEAHAFIRAQALVYGDVGEILTHVNRLVCQDMEDEQFITVFLGSLDSHERTFVYASAGHQGFLLDSFGKLTKLDSTALPLGVSPTEVVPCAPAIHLEVGCFVLLITDGVFEAMAPDGRPFGMDRAIAIVQSHRDQRAETIVELLCQALERFTQGRPQGDDITAVVVKSQAIAAPIGSTTETMSS